MYIFNELFLNNDLALVYLIFLSFVALKLCYEFTKIISFEAFYFYGAHNHNYVKHIFKKENKNILKNTFYKELIKTEASTGFLFVLYMIWIAVTDSLAVNRIWIPFGVLLGAILVFFITDLYRIVKINRIQLFIYSLSCKRFKENIDFELVNVLKDEENPIEKRKLAKTLREIVKNHEKEYKSSSVNSMEIFSSLNLVLGDSEKVYPEPKTLLNEIKTVNERLKIKFFNKKYL